MALLGEGMRSWNAPVSAEGELQHAQVILSHEFGDQEHVQGTNQELQNLALRLRYRYHIPWIAQFPQGKIGASYLISQNKAEPGRYLNAHEVNRQAAEICAENGWERVILVVHPHFAWRARKDLEQFGLTVSVPDLLEIHYHWIPKRPVLGTPWLFIPREIIARGVFWFRGWLG